MFGQILIHLLFGTAVVTSAAYFLALKKGEVYQSVGRNLYRLFSALMLLASGWLMYNVLTHNFQYTYIWGHSSRDLPMHLLASTFYAGQEGSFMLWTFFTTMIGLALLPYVRRHDYESEVMSFYSFILVFLSLMLVAKNPFAYVWETFASDPGIYAGLTPENGRGLNPLLHNGWITIHPPILFIGFASMAVPFAFAMGALVKKRFHEWIDISLPWTLFATAVLGFGIMLGGFWAYESLGWGGFWGWDPVENSSLIPWLAAVALVHTMLVQKKTKGLVKTNIIIAISAYLLVLYSTFLTRSGVLGDTSVHSFVEPGMFAKLLLIGFVVIFAAVGIGMVLYRRREIAVEKKEFAPASREFLLSIGSALTLGSAIIITLGTSWPVIAEFVGQPKVAVDVSFYNTMHLPLVIAILLTNAISLLLKWRMSNTADSFKNSLLALGLAILATGISFALGVRDIGYILLTFAAWFSLFINAELALKIIRGNPKFVGAYISHAGIALLMLGVIATSGYSQMTHARLVQGVPTKALGYTLTFHGREQIEKQFTDKEKYEYHITAEKDGFKTRISPVLFWSDFNKRSTAFLEPGIEWSLAQDFYISPKSIEQEDNFQTKSLMKNQSLTVPIDTSVKLTMQRFDMSEAMAGGAAAGGLKLAAIVNIEQNGITTEQKLYSLLKQDGGQMNFEPEWYTIPGTPKQIGLMQVVRDQQNPEKSQAFFGFKDLNAVVKPNRDVFTVEVSIKPLINLVWFGVIAMVTGFFISIARHRDELRRKRNRTTPPDVIRPVVLKSEKVVAE